MKSFKLAMLGLITTSSTVFAAALPVGSAKAIQGEKAVILPNPILKKAIVIRENLDTGVISILGPDGKPVPGRVASAADLQSVCYGPGGVPCGPGFGYRPGPDIVYQDGYAGYGAPIAPPVVVRKRVIREHIEAPTATIDRKVIKEHIETPDATIHRRITKERVIDRTYELNQLYGAPHGGYPPEILEEE